MNNITGILLAAGASSRFGSAKLLHPLAHNRLVGIASAETLLKVLPESIVIVRPGDRELINAYKTLGIKVVVNSQADEGMASSIITGVCATRESNGWIIALADMPWVQPATIKTLAEQLLKGASMVAPVYQGQRGNPVGFSSTWGTELLQLQGDKGARELLIQHNDNLSLLAINDPGVTMDIDSPDDLLTEE